MLPPMNVKRTAAASAIAVAGSLALASTSQADGCDYSWHPVMGCSGWDCYYWQAGLNALSNDHHYLLDLGGGNYQIGYVSVSCVVTVT